ncbi:hypothetical protein BD779DRAFT_1800632, partial [Infundibulicybe gibba]
MRLSTAFLPLVSALAVAASPLNNGTTFEKRAISKYSTSNVAPHVPVKVVANTASPDASSAYATACARPNGNTLFSNAATDTQGFIARDEQGARLLLLCAEADFIVDSEYPRPFVSPGVNPPAGATAHTGFLTAWNSVPTRSSQPYVRSWPPIRLRACVYGPLTRRRALESGGVALQQNFPGSATRMFTYGQPRTFNPTGANFVNAQFGGNAFRSVHT